MLTISLYRNRSALTHVSYHALTPASNVRAHLSHVPSRAAPHLNPTNPFAFADQIHTYKLAVYAARMQARYERQERRQQWEEEALRASSIRGEDAARVFGTHLAGDWRGPLRRSQFS